MTEKETLAKAKAEEKPFTLEQRIEKLTTEGQQATQKLDQLNAFIIQATGKIELLNEMIVERDKGKKKP